MCSLLYLVPIRSIEFSPVAALILQIYDNRNIAVFANIAAAELLAVNIFLCFLVLFIIRVAAHFVALATMHSYAEPTSTLIWNGIPLQCIASISHRKLHEEVIHFV